MAEEPDGDAVDELALTAALSQFFEDDDWPAVFDYDRGCYVVRFQGTQASWTCLAFPVEAEATFVFYSVAPVHADRAHLGPVAEYLTRANDGLLLGNFELVYRTGEVRYKTSIDVTGAVLEPALIKHVVYANVQAMDRYLAGLMLVLADGASPEAAIARAEASAGG